MDTSVLVDDLRGRHEAASVRERERGAGPLDASEITRLEVLAGMRSVEEQATRPLLATLRWHPVDEGIAEQAGVLGRRWLPSHQAVDDADLVIAATTVHLGARLQTLDIRHFPMFSGLTPTY